VKIGRPDSWWNRRVPIARICLIVGVLLAGLYVWGAYGGLIDSVAWGVRHQLMASFRGQTLKVPWFWREEEWVNYNEFELTRPYGGFVVPSSVTVRYEDIAPGDVQKRMEIMKRNNAQALSRVPGWFYDDYKGDDFSRTNYVCLEQGLMRSSIFAVDCFSRDGRWSVRIFGSRQSQSEFELILRGVASMGNPTT